MSLEQALQENKKEVKKAQQYFSEKLSRPVNLFIQLPGEAESELLRDFMVLLFDLESLAQKLKDPLDEDDSEGGGEENL